MKYTLFLLLLLPNLLLAQEFEFRQEFDTIPIQVNGYQLPCPWIGGYECTAPDLVDIDGDLDFDLMLGWSNVYLVFWKNTGTLNNEQWQLEDEQFLNINESIGFLRPKFWDMDADGDFDLFLSSYPDPIIAVYENTSSSTEITFNLVTDTLRNSSGGVIYCQKSDLADLDGDGDQDLICGEFGGFLDYYENIGDSVQYLFYFSESHFAGIGVGYGAAPTFCDIDSDGDFDLFIGNNNGNIWFYRNNGTPQVYDFVLESNCWLGIDAGDDAIPEFCDIDGDGDFDLFIGKGNDYDITPPGDMQFWRNVGTPQNYDFVQENDIYLTFDAGDNLNVHLVDLEDDNDGDMFIEAQYLGWLRNVGTPTDPIFNLMSLNILYLGIGTFGFGDLDADGDDDMIFSLGWQIVTKYYENIGDDLNPSFIYRGNIVEEDTVGTPNLVDIDADGDLDLLMSHYNWTVGDSAHLWLYENQGTPERFNFVLVDENFCDLSFGPGPDIEILDYDFDGDYDIMNGDDPGSRYYYYENIGTPQVADYVYAGEFNIAPYSPLNTSFWDIDNDQDMDLFAGQFAGGIVFFRNLANDTSTVQPHFSLDIFHGIQFTLAPNPANPVTWITYQLPYPQKAELAVYNLLGQKVAVLASGFMLPGRQTVTWNAGDYPSGVYWICLQAEQMNDVKKIVVVK